MTGFLRLVDGFCEAVFGSPPQMPIIDRIGGRGEVPVEGHPVRWTKTTWEDGRIVSVTHPSLSLGDFCEACYPALYDSQQRGSVKLVFTRHPDYGNQCRVEPR